LHPYPSSLISMHIGSARARRRHTTRPSAVPGGQPQCKTPGEFCPCSSDAPACACAFRQALRPINIHSLNQRFRFPSSAFSRGKNCMLICHLAAFGRLVKQNRCPQLEGPRSALGERRGYLIGKGQAGSLDEVMIGMLVVVASRFAVLGPGRAAGASTPREFPKGRTAPSPRDVPGNEKRPKAGARISDGGQGGT